MIVSPFTPLFFIDRKADGIDSEYIQTFADSDRILIEVLGDARQQAPAAWVFNNRTNTIEFRLQWNSWDINSSTRLFFYELTLEPGFYTVHIEGIGTCNTFRVTNDVHELSETTLIQYSMRNNRQRDDTVFFINGLQYFFDFRVPGGFKDSGWSFNVDSEQFVTQYADISQLYGLESTQKTFTLGSGIGVPVWFGEMLNRILTCSHVYFDGVKYCRKDASVPEMDIKLNGVNSFVFTQKLQQSNRLDPTLESNIHAILRRSSESNRRIISSDINRII